MIFCFNLSLLRFSFAEIAEFGGGAVSERLDV